MDQQEKLWGAVAIAAREGVTVKGLIIDSFDYATLLKEIGIPQLSGKAESSVKLSGPYGPVLIVDAAILSDKKVN